MAQTGYTPILIYASGTATNVPLAANLTSSASGAELALNYADGKLYFKNSSGVVTLLAGSGGGGPAAGSNTQIQFNNGGVFGASANLTWDGTYLTAGSIKDSALTSGRVTYATTSGQLTDSANLLYSGTDLTVYGITVGRGAGAVSSNTALGTSALAAANTGTGGNTALGYYSLAANTSGYQNTAVGQQALRFNDVGYLNAAIGYQSLLNTVGAYNTAVGAYSGNSNTSGNYNTAIGGQALQSNTTASYNTAVGYQAAYNNTTGNVTAIGYQAGYANTTSANLTFVGNSAGLYATGSSNTAVGTSALLGSSGASTGSSNSAFGYLALTANTTGNSNSAFGQQALSGNTTGSCNIAIGQESLRSNTTAANNTAVGYQAGYSNTTGGITALGYQALYTATTAGNTVGLGFRAGYSHTTANGGCYIGHEAGYSTTGAANTFVGSNNGSTGSAGYYVTTGAKNTILGCYNGNQGGLDIRTASNYIVLSDGDGNPRGIFDSSGNLLVGNTTAGVGGQSGFSTKNIGSTNCYTSFNHSSGSTSGADFIAFAYNGTQIGGVSQNGTTGVLFNITSDYRLKNNPTALTGSGEFIDALQPKTWDWWDGSGKGVGFIAHEFMEVAKYSGHGEKDAVDADGKPVHQTIQPSSSEVMAYLVAEIQSLRKRLAAAGIV